MKRPAREIISWGRLLFERRLVTGWGGNMSVRLGRDRYLITGQHAPLGFLTAKDLVAIDGNGAARGKGRQPSSETPLHLAAYRATDAGAVIHAHPPMALTFSLAHGSFEPVSYEERYTVGEVPILPQETPTVIETEKVAEALRLNAVVILKGHGTVAVGKDLQEAFLLTDLLEEAIRCQSFAPEKKEGADARGAAAPPDAGAEGNGYRLFSREHMAALVERANTDPEFQSQGKLAGLTTSLTLHLEETDTPWTVHFDNGLITGFEPGGHGEFLISGKREWWEAIFRRRLDPFMATQQGKLRLKRGEMWKLSRWFKPFQRAFALWQAIPVK